jgi:hypothetical protein
LSLDSLIACVWRACELLSLDDGFVAGGDPGQRLLSLTRSFVDEMGGMVSVLVEHNSRLEEMFDELVGVALGLVSALEVAGDHVGSLDGGLLWWEELGEPALEGWKVFRNEV